MAKIVSLVRAGIEPPPGTDPVDGHIPSSMEDYIRANNAHLQVILKNQAEITTMLTGIAAYVVSTVGMSVYPDDEKARERHTTKCRELDELMRAATHSAYKLDVHKHYLEVLLEKHV
jgi:hypothetical protein